MVTLVNFALQTKETCVMLIQNIYGEFFDSFIHGLNQQWRSVARSV